MFTVERYHDFSAGHRVVGHESKCAHLHGHNYRVTFSVVPSATEPERCVECGKTRNQAEHTTRTHPFKSPDKQDLDDVGRVLDFSVVKSKLCQWLEDNWDHKFMVFIHDPMLETLCNLDPDGIAVVTFNPTAENMANYLVEVIGPQVLKNTGAVLLGCRVEETRKCAAKYFRGS